LQAVYCALQQLLHCNKPEVIAMSTNDLMSTWTDLTNKGLERMNALGELNLKVAETLTTRQMDLMTLFMEQGARMMTIASEAKDYSDLYKGQVGLAREATEHMREQSKQGMKLAGEIRDDYRGWLDAALSDARDGNVAMGDAVSG
jgi:hypothetical protein